MYKHVSTEFPVQFCFKFYFKKFCDDIPVSERLEISFKIKKRFQTAA